MATRPVNDDELTSAELNTRPRDRVVGHERELRDSIVVRNASTIVVIHTFIFYGLTDACSPSV